MTQIIIIIKVIFYCNTLRVQHELVNGERWVRKDSPNFDTILQFVYFCRRFMCEIPYFQDFMTLYLLKVLRTVVPKEASKKGYSILRCLLSLRGMQISLTYSMKIITLGDLFKLLLINHRPVSQSYHLQVTQKLRQNLAPQRDPVFLNPSAEHYRTQSQWSFLLCTAYPTSNRVLRSVGGHWSPDSFVR